MEIAIIPESAPFNPEQRAWLNGFLAGWMGISGNGAPQAAAGLAALAPAAAVEEAAPEPWHDPAIPIDERLKLAEGEPLPRRLMAAMAQLDCGACGYLCKTYSQAIADGSETRLTLCSPGGAETSKTLKRLVKEKPAAAVPAAESNGKAVAKNGAAVVSTAAKAPASRWSRDTPYTARLLKS